MKKLKLNVEELAVEQFEVASSKQEKGTVAGYATVDPYTDPCLYCIRMPATARC
ncbi:MAG TPA: hypothetical protein VLK84_28260 [Longimicrobium sp.]|nr:hypothetical protein [Longimicrobium sp.]